MDETDGRSPRLIEASGVDLTFANFGNGALADQRANA
jgi:hypothetical protein